MEHKTKRKTFSDNYEHDDDKIEYILENVLQDDDGSDEFKVLEELFNSKIINGCQCVNSICSKKCIHGGNYKFLNGELVLSDNRICEDLIYECNDDCKCSTRDCINRFAQFGPRDDLTIQQFTGKGLGLISSEQIAKGSFICEYAGEILTKSEAMRRDKQNQTDKKMNYILCLNEISTESGSNTFQTFVDPSKKGNIGRYLNHSCDPNCSVLSVRFDSIIPKIAIYANRVILPFEELTFCYGTSIVFEKESKLCLCNSLNCKMYLPNISFS